MDKEVYEVLFKDHLIATFTINNGKYCYESNIEGIMKVQDTISLLTKYMYDTPGNMGPIPFFVKIIDHMRWWNKDEVCYPDVYLVVRRRNVCK